MSPRRRLRPQQRRDRHAVDRHRLTASGKLADVAAEYLKVGSRVYVEGTLQQSKLIVGNLVLLRPKSAL